MWTNSVHRQTQANIQQEKPTKVAFPSLHVKLVSTQKITKSKLATVTAGKNVAHNLSRDLTQTRVMNSAYKMKCKAWWRMDGHLLKFRARYVVDPPLHQ